MQSFYRHDSVPPTWACPGRTFTFISLVLLRTSKKPSLQLFGSVPPLDGCGRLANEAGGPDRRLHRSGIRLRPCPVGVGPLSPIISFPSHPPLLHRESPLLARPPSSNFTEAPWSHSTEEEAINLAAPSIYLPLPLSLIRLILCLPLLSFFLSFFPPTMPPLTT